MPYTSTQERAPSLSFTTADLSRRLGALTTTAPTQSARYHSGRGALLAALSQRRQQDAAAAAARGLTGGTYEIAAAEARNRALLSGERALVADAADAQQREALALQQLLLQAQGMRSQEKQARDAARASRWGAVAGIAGTALGAVLGGPIGAGIGNRVGTYLGGKVKT